MVLSYDRRLGRYRDDVGRLVSDSRIRLAVDAVADAASDRMADVTERLITGDVTLARWQTGMLAVIKHSHIAAGVVAQGGRAQMTPSTYGYLGSEIRAQYAYLRAFGAQIAAETVPLDRRLVSRAGMYGQHARVTYESIRARDAAARGYVQERNILHAKESCDQCITLTQRGWVPTGSLPPIGARSCLARCRCTISRRKTHAGPVPLRVVA
jgi:hypothetical protein